MMKVAFFIYFGSTDFSFKHVLIRVTLVTLTKYFCDRRLLSVSQKYMVAKMSQFPCKFH